MLLSDNIKEDDKFFYYKPKTEYHKFQLGFMCINHGSITASFGHELIHKRDFFSKFLGF